MIGTILSKGCLLAFKVEGSGEPVVFIQGTGLHGDGWLPQTDTLKSDFHCVTFDNRGMGQSQPAGVEITVSQMAEDALTVMNAVGIHAAHLVGHSLGGSVALQVAATAPDRVSSLALLCTSARGSDATTPSPRMIWLGLRSRLGSRRMRSSAFLEMVMPPEYLAKQDRGKLAEGLRPFFGHDLCDSPAIAMRQLMALRDFDISGRLNELPDVPTLVVSAARDIIFPPAFGKTLAAGIAGARFLEIPDAAHGVTIQCYETVNRLLHEHFSSAKSIR